MEWGGVRRGRKVGRREGESYRRPLKQICSIKKEKIILKMQKTAYEEQKATFEDSWVSLIACKKVIIIEKSGQTGNENVSSSHKPRVHREGQLF